MIDKTMDSQTSSNGHRYFMANPNHMSTSRPPVMPIFECDGRFSSSSAPVPPSKVCPRRSAATPVAPAASPFVLKSY